MRTCLGSGGLPLWRAHEAYILVTYPRLDYVLINSNMIRNMRLSLSLFFFVDRV